MHRANLMHPARIRWVVLAALAGVMLFLATGQAFAAPENCGTHYDDGIKVKCKTTISTSTNFWTGATVSRTNQKIDKIYAHNKGYELCATEWPKISWNLDWTTQYNAQYASAGGSDGYQAESCFPWGYLSTGGSHNYEIDGDHHWHTTQKDIPHPRIPSGGDDE